MTKRIDTLLHTLRAPPDSLPERQIRRWCEASRPFLAFAEEHATKIRRKVRQAGTPDETLALLGELAVAAAFLSDARFGVRYEPQKAGGERSPDLQAVFKGHTVLNVEVTRLRGAGALDEAGLALRLARVLCDKIGQFPGGALNLLLILLPEGVTAPVAEAVRLLDRFPDGPGAAVLRAEGVTAFRRGRPRLGAVATAEWSEAGGLRVGELWLNRQARQPLPPELLRVVERLA